MDVRLPPITHRPKQISFYEREKEYQRRIENLRLVKVICKIEEACPRIIGNQPVVRSVQIQNRLRIQKQIEFENKVDWYVIFRYSNSPYAKRLEKLFSRAKSDYSRSQMLSDFKRHEKFINTRHAVKLKELKNNDANVNLKSRAII